MSLRDLTLRELRGLRDLRACTWCAARAGTLLIWVTLSASLAAISLISVDQEIQIGRDANAQVKKETPEITDSQILSYIRGIGRQLAAHAGGPKYPYSYSIANYREINAFALPGGPVWVHRGAIEAAKNESQLVGVLAHETAHVALRHAADQLTKATMANGALALLGAVLGNGGGARTAEVAARFMAGGYMLKFSRDDEREADRVGAQIMRRAGWDNRGMLEFMQVLRDRQGRNPSSVEVFLSTHPAPVAPGPVCTPLNPSDNKSSEQVAHFGENTPMGRPAQPEEIAPAYVFFASNIDSSYVTGEVLTLLGGETTAG